MSRLNDILHELGISKVKLAKVLGVSRQMIYNYLELDDLNKWPKDKKVLLLNLLGIKTVEELDDIKIDTDYILEVETRLNNVIETDENTSGAGDRQGYSDFGKKQKELLDSLVDLIKERLEDESDNNSYYALKYMYHFLQSIDSWKELKYLLGYVAKSTGFVKPGEFVFNEEAQFTFEGIIDTAFVLYNSGNGSKTKIAEAHKRFVERIEHKMDEKMSRTLELNTLKVQALKELGYTTINEANAQEVLEKIAEIQSRKITNIG